jgi:hypothetical protein
MILTTLNHCHDRVFMIDTLNPQPPDGLSRALMSIMLDGVIPGRPTVSSNPKEKS